MVFDPGQQESGSEINQKGATLGVDLSVVIPICDRFDDLKQLFQANMQEISSFGFSTEFLFVVDGPHLRAVQTLQELKKDHPNVRIITLNHSVGEAAALTVGFEHANGKYVATLAAYFQVEPGEIKQMIGQLIEGKDDLVISWRNPRIDSLFNRFQSKVFHWMVKLLTGQPFHDISCGLRVMKMEVAKEIALYGDLHRFFPLLAFRRGFKIRERKVQQSPHDCKIRLQSPGVYIRRMLDLLVLFFLFRFTQKPLRFFGLIGISLFGIGAVITGYMGIARLFFGVGLSERPLLIASALLIVLGAQLFSVGLLGEIIIFTNSREAKDYQIKEVLK